VTEELTDMPAKTCNWDVRACYAVAVLLGAMDLEQFCWPSWLTYGGHPRNDDRSRVHIIASKFFADGYGTPSSLPVPPLAEIEGVPLPFGKPITERCGRTLVVHADIIASTYFLTTRYEEWMRGDVRDEHGRFPGKASLPCRAGFIDRPVVDEYASLLRKWAGLIGIEIPKPDRRFSVLLTHDVDFIGPPRGSVRAARCIVSGVLGRRPLRRAMRDATVAGRLRDHPCDNLDEVVRLDQWLTGCFPPDRCRSMYFFMAGGHTPYDGGYHLRSSRVLRRLQYVSQSGADIGLHASYEAGAEPIRVGIERRVLQEAAGLPIEKNRHHFLCWREPEHGVAIAEGGIRWDATLGYADIAGFRLGVCRPIPLFDPIRQRPLGIEEHPLIVMDCTLDRPSYMNLGEDAAFDHVRRLADATSQHQGEFVMLWHNTVLASSDASYHRRLYPRVLDYLGKLLSAA